MPDEIVLIGKEHSKTGRTLVQRSNHIWVLSACCNAPIDGLLGWCNTCSDNSMEEPRYSADFRLTHAGIINSRSSWPGWLQYWFGIEDGMMTYNDGS